MVNAHNEDVFFAQSRRCNLYAVKLQQAVCERIMSGRTKRSRKFFPSGFLKMKDARKDKDPDVER